MMTTTAAAMIIMRSSRIEWVQRIVPVKPLYGRGGEKTDVAEGNGRWREGNDDGNI